MLKANPDQMALLRQNNPKLAEALDADNMDEFTKVIPSEIGGFCKVMQ